jgi:hypothetical protein
MSQERENYWKLAPWLYGLLVALAVFVLWVAVTHKNGDPPEESLLRDGPPREVDTTTGSKVAGIPIEDAQDVGEEFFEDQPTHGDLERTIEEQELDDQDIRMEQFYDEDSDEDPIIHEAFDDGPDQIGEQAENLPLLREDDLGELVQ